MSSLAYPITERSTEELCRKIASDVATHARFLNTVSMLEYIGARKIMKSQESSVVDMDTLVHATEEIRHAWLIKRLAQKLCSEVTSTYESECLLCGEEGEAYIQILDAAVKEELLQSPPEWIVTDAKMSWLNYLYTSLLIEERAEVFYGVYVEVLDDLGLGNSLKAIIKDEAKHLEQMIERISRLDMEAPKRLKRLRDVEKEAFGRFERALWSQVEQSSAN